MGLKPVLSDLTGCSPNDRTENATRKTSFTEEGVSIRKGKGQRSADSALLDQAVCCEGYCGGSDDVGGFSSAGMLLVQALHARSRRQAGRAWPLI